MRNAEFDLAGNRDDLFANPGDPRDPSLVAFASDGETRAPGASTSGFDSDTGSVDDVFSSFGSVGPSDAPTLTGGPGPEPSQSGPTDETQDSTSTLDKPSTWRSIRVENRSSQRSVPDHYAVQVQVPAQQWRDQGIDVHAGELALVYGTPDQHSSIPYTVDPDANWSTDTTVTIWFALQHSIPQGAQSTSEYHFVLGDNTLDARIEPESVFLTFDDFSQSTLSHSRWDESYSLSSLVSASTQGGRLELTSYSGLAMTWSQVRTAQRWSRQGLRFEARVSVPMQTNSNDCTYEHMMTAWSMPDDRMRSGIFQQEQAYRHCGARDADGLQFLISDLPNAPTPDANSHRYALDWYGTTSRLYQDFAMFGQGAPQDQVASPDLADISFGFKTWTRGSAFCSLAIESSRIFVDWAYVRESMDTEPSAVLE